MNEKDTQGSKKVMLLFQRLFDTEVFQEEVIKAREELGIPRGGCKFTRQKKTWMDRWWRPAGPYTLMGSNPLYDQKRLYTLVTKKIHKRLPVDSDYLKYVLRDYIYFNDRDVSKRGTSRSPSRDVDVCKITDAEEEFSVCGLDEDSAPDILRHNDNVGDFIYPYPVAIRIHADASQRSIVDYIKRNWAAISASQKAYSLMGEKASHIRSARTKENVAVKARMDFIYKHRTLPHKIIRKKLADNGYGFFDDGYIGKIVSLEKKRRQGN